MRNNIARKMYLYLIRTDRLFHLKQCLSYIPCILSRRLYSLRFKVPAFSMATMYTNLKPCLFTVINTLDVVKTIGLTIKQKQRL